MKQLIFTLVLGVCYNNTAQYANKPLREDFDYLFNSSVFISPNSTYSVYKYEPSHFYNTVNNCDRSHFLDQLGDGNSYLMLALLNMYEVTLDKDYLIKFIIQANRILLFRRDMIQGVTSIEYPPRWDFDLFDEFGTCTRIKQMYHDGLLLNPYARFVYMIKIKYPHLMDTPLPKASINGLSPVANVGGTNVVSTYGDVATNYKTQTEFSLDWFISNGYWGDDNRTFLPTPDGDDKNRPQVVNQVIGFANALYYLGLVGNANYAAKAELIAKRFLSSPVNEDGEDDNVTVRGGSGIKCISNLDCGKITITSVFQPQSDDSYIWYGSGWRISDCGECDRVPGVQTGPDDFEDISHGALTTAFPATHATESFLNTGVNNYFNYNFYPKLHNTLTKRICTTGDANGRLIIHSGVDGSDEITYNTNLNGPNDIEMRKILLEWVWLYPWDVPGGRSVYDMCMTLYGEMESDKLLADNSIRGNTNSLKGLSQLTQAQWDKECTNNTLFNRNLTYNQDFFAKNTLTIDPSKDTYDAYNITRIGGGATQSGNESYNEPIINTPTFVIAPGVTSNMTAGESIVLKAGTHIMAHSTFHASIAPSSCTDGHRPANPNEVVKVKGSVQPENTTVEKETTASKTQLSTPSITSFQNNLAAIPNPFSDATDLVFSLQSSGSVTITIVNNLGQVVYTQFQEKELNAGKYVIPVPTENFSQGMYHCLLMVDNQQMMTAVLVKQ